MWLIALAFVTLKTTLKTKRGNGGVFRVGIILFQISILECTDADATMRYVRNRLWRR